MDTQIAFAKALRRIRKGRGMSQEDFGEVASRTYLSQLERGLKNPTLGMIEQLSTAMGVQPLTLVVATYLEKVPNAKPEEVLARVLEEIKALNLE